MIKLILGKCVTLENHNRSRRKQTEVAVIFAPSVSAVTNARPSYRLGFQLLEIISGTYASISHLEIDYLLSQISRL